jgi:glycosyltransferase involved in cell wall biosynthesis
MPNYNHSQFLPKSLGALVERERSPDELIIIDDGSTDNSWNIIQDFATRYPFIRAFRNTENLGCVPTVEKALALASGDYVHGAAADDYVLPGFYEKSMALLDQYPEAGLCCTIGDWREVHTGLRWNMGAGMTNVPAYLSPERMMDVEREGRLFIAGHTVIVKRSALFEAGGFPEAAKYGSDWFAYYLIGFQHGICVVPEALAVNRIDANTYYNRGRRDKAGNLKVMEAIMRLLVESNYPEAVERIRKCGALYVWGYPMLRVLLGERAYRRFLTPTFLRKNIWHTTRLFLKRHAPTALINWYLGKSGYRTQPVNVQESRS